MDRVLREHRPGHIGSTPQDTDAIMAGGRAAGMEADFSQRFQAPEVGRVDAYMHPPAQEPLGYFSDADMALQIGAAVQRMQPGVMRRGVDPKTFGDVPGIPIEDQ